MSTTMAQGNGRPSGRQGTVVPRWSEVRLRQALQELQQAVPVTVLTAGARPRDDGRSRQEQIERLMRLAKEPEVWAALQGRTDLHEAVRDLATRDAFHQVMLEGRSSFELDDLSRAMLQRTLQMIYRYAEYLSHVHGENPLDADPGLLPSLGKTLAKYVPHKPMSWYIRKKKMPRPDSAVSRVMAQIEHLVEHKDVRESFIAFVQQVALPRAFISLLARRATERRVAAEQAPADRARAKQPVPSEEKDVDPMPTEEVGEEASDWPVATLVAEFKAQMVQMARTGLRGGVDVEVTIHFFALPKTVAWVKTIAERVETARTLYAEEEYAGVPWRRKRALRAERPRQGLFEQALAQLQRQRQVSLDHMHRQSQASQDMEDLDAYEVLSAESATVVSAGSTQDNPDLDLFRNEPFESWATHALLEHRPDDPVWQAARWLYVVCLAPEEVVRRGLADAETVTAAQQALAGLRANQEVWEAYMEARGLWEASMESSLR